MPLAVGAGGCCKVHHFVSSGGQWRSKLDMVVAAMPLQQAKAEPQAAAQGILCQVPGVASYEGRGTGQWRPSSLVIVLGLDQTVQQSE